MYKKYDDQEIQIWIEQGASIHLKASTPGHNDPVELTSDEARSVARKLFELSIELDYEDGVDKDWFRIPMQYLMIYAEQDPTVNHEEQYGGAYVGCWIKDQTEQNALYIAKSCIIESGWIFISLEEHLPIKRGD